MAGLCPSRRILVKNIQAKANCDKLTIHFQKKKHGGCGDVLSITFPKSDTEPDQAVVEFENPATVTSVLQCSHVFLGQQLEVTEFPVQTFGQSDIVISDAAINKLLASQDQCKLIKDSTGVYFHFDSQNGKWHLKGEWYQIMAAMQKIERIVAIDIHRGVSSSEKSAKCEHSSSSTEGAATSSVQDGGAVPKKVQPIQRENACEVKLDDNVYAYMKICHPDYCKTIARKHKVKLEEGISKVLFLPTTKSGPTGVKNAMQQFSSVYTQFFASIKICYFNMKSLKNAHEIEISEAMSTMNESKKVMIGRNQRKGLENLLVFLAQTKHEAESAIATFRNMFAPEKGAEIANFKVSTSGLKVSVVHGDFRREKTDAVLSEVNLYGQGPIVSECNQDIKKDVIEWLNTVNSNKWTNPVHVSEADSGLNCKRILHYYLNLNNGFSTEDAVEMALHKCLEFAHQRSTPFLTLPFNCIAHGMKHSDLVNSIFVAISKFNSTHQMLESNLNEIRVVHNNLYEAHKCADALRALEYPKETNDADASSSGRSSRKNSAKEAENQKEVCAICLDDLSGAMSMKTLPCQHTFHQACIDRAFSVAKKCPMCMRFYGKPEGTQPRNATMTSRVISQRLPGYTCDSILIDYRIPSGTQGPEHPNPGQRYHGTSRQAYLPNNPDGGELLLLLRKAFDARLTFTVGRSVTTGADNCVTWNDIHHKTNIYGGPTGFGYPDPGYPGRLRLELADKGITPDSN